MNTLSKKFNSDQKDSIKVAISFKLVLLIVSFILALIGSWSLEGLFFRELFVSGVIICSLMWVKEVSLRSEVQKDSTNSTNNY